MTSFKDCRMLLALFVLLFLQSGPAIGAMSLVQAINRALERDPGLAASGLERDRQTALVDVARGGYFPTLTATSRVGWRQIETVAGRDSLQTSRHSLSFRQSIYAGGGVAAALAAAKSRMQTAQAALILSEQQLLLEVVEAYISVLQDQAMLELAIGAEHRLEQHSDAIRQRYRFGAVTAGDVARAEAKQAAAAAIRRQSAGNLKVSGATFKERVGDPPGELLVPAVPKELPLSLEEALQALDTHPALERAQYLVDAAGHDVDVATALMRPRLSLEGDAAFADQPEAVTSGRQDMAIALNIVVPLYQGGVASAKQHAAALEAERQAKLAEQDAALLETVIIAAWERWQAGLDGNKARSRQVAAAELARDSFVDEAKIGERSLMDLIDAENELLQAQTAAATGQLETIADSYRLLVAMGTIEFKTLN